MPILAQEHDWIMAVASGTVTGAISIVRVSGRGCHQGLAPLFDCDFAQLVPRQLVWTRLIPVGAGEPLDHPMLVLFRDSASYTGEESAEIHLHASPFVVETCLQALRDQGFRDAEPGEFTRRAYLNGRLDLTQAEGVAALIGAQSRDQWRAAQHLASGALSAHLSELRRNVLAALAWVEARIDFPDEREPSSVAWADLDQKVDRVEQALAQLAASFDSGRLAREGVRVVFLGPPNAGKSTLMNAFLGHERAIVTPISGTTRDYLEENVRIGAHLCRIVDTAGLRTTADPIEQMGIAKSLELAASADLVLLLIPNDLEHPEPLQSQLAALSAAATLRVATKSDLAATPAARLVAASGEKPLEWNCNDIKCMEQLCQAIARWTESRLSPLAEGFFLTHNRHLAAVAAARRALVNYFVQRREGAFEEMLSFELREAASHLRELMGQVDHEDVLEMVFSHFCVGK